MKKSHDRKINFSTTKHFTMDSYNAICINREINFSPMEEHFTKEQVDGVCKYISPKIKGIKFTEEELSGIDKFMEEPIVDGIVRFVKEKNSSGLLMYRSRLIKNPTWFDAMNIAIEQSRKTKDTHHVWLEDFEIVGFQYELAFGKVQRVTLVRLGLGS